MAKKKTISKTSAKKTVETTDHLEQIQDGNLKDFKKEVEKLDNLKDIEKLEKIEHRDDTRKGAQEIIDKRKAELAGDEQPETEGDTITPEDEAFEDEKPKTFDEEVEANLKEEPKEPESPTKPLTDEEKKALDDEWEENKKKAKAEAIENIKEHRLTLDKLLCKMQHHGRIDLTPERSFFLAKAWLGICLAEIGADNPYAGEDKIQSRKDIPATAEHDDSNHFKAECVQFNNLNTENALIGLRSELLKTIDFIQGINSFDYTREFAIARTQAWVNAREARFFLGVILGSLKV